MDWYSTHWVDQAVAATMDAGDVRLVAVAGETLQVDDVLAQAARQLAQRDQLVANPNMLPGSWASDVVDSAADVLGDLTTMAGGAAGVDTLLEALVERWPGLPAELVQPTALLAASKAAVGAIQRMIQIIWDRQRPVGLTQM